jgi:hypothetical protein
MKVKLKHILVVNNIEFPKQNKKKNGIFKVQENRNSATRSISFSSKNLMFSNSNLYKFGYINAFNLFIKKEGITNTERVKISVKGEKKKGYMSFPLYYRPHHNVKTCLLGAQEY